MTDKNIPLPGCMMPDGAPPCDEYLVLSERCTKLEQTLIGTANALKFMLDHENEKLKAGICSTDLDDPDYLDYQTVHEAMKAANPHP